MTGNKTYLGSVVLVVIGLVAILMPDSSTWKAPSGQAKDFLGFGLLALGWLCFSLRHAIKTTKEHFDRVLASYNKAMTDRIGVMWSKMDAIHKDLDKED